jgi:hypothetical protein
VVLKKGVSSMVLNSFGIGFNKGLVAINNNLLLS